MERGRRKRSSSAGREKLKVFGDRKGKLEEYCFTGQSPQWSVVPMEEEEEEEEEEAEEEEENREALTIVCSVL
jgi:hypothetical protein